MFSMNRIVRFVGVVALLAATPCSVLARGSGGSSGGGRSSSSSGSRSSSSSGSSWGGSGSRSAPASAPASSPSSGGSGSGSSSSTASRSGGAPPSSSPQSGWGSSSRFSSAPTGNSRGTDAAIARKSGESARTFSSRSDAVRDFEATHAKNYSSSYSNEPSSRPSHIPQTVLVDNRSYPVHYDVGHRGYGYWDSSGWRTYEVVRDAVMLGALMQHHNYNYGGGYGPGHSSYGQPFDAPPYYHNSGMGLVSGLICCLFLFVIVRVALRIIF